MSRDSKGEERRRRDSEDQIRDRDVYRYLLALTDLQLSSKAKAPNETSIAKQWGVEDNRIFIRRMLRSVLFDRFYKKKDENQPPPVPGLTLSKLVSILSALEAYQRAQQFQNSEAKIPRLITRAEKLKALRLFFQLLPEERQRLGLELHPGQIFLNQISELANTSTVNGKPADAISLYNFFLRQSEGAALSFAEAIDQSDKESSQAYIQKIVTQHTQQYFAGLSKADKNELDKKLIEKVEREIGRIELQSGIEQVNSFLKKDEVFTRNNRLLNYLTADFIQRLAHSVIDNELITDEFPIHLKFFEIERVKPLPLYIKQAQETTGLLNPFLLQDSHEDDSVNGLERQVAYRVTAHFYIKVPEDYKATFEDLAVINRVSGQRRLEFSEEVVGIGCPTSHITAVINRVLLWDIPVLKGYASVADGVYCNDEIMGGTPNSPVWSHCIARLYKTQDIHSAIELEDSCDAIATTVETATADFCGFDLLETTAKAALYARLKLIKQTLANQPDVSAEQYIKELCHRVEEMTAMKRAQQCLHFYPFSLRAMEGQLEATIFKSRYRLRKPGFIFEEYQPNVCWSAIALEAQVSIAEANLKEGLLHIARQYLEIVRPYFEGEDKDQVGDLPMTRYHLCWFRYYYLSDLDDPACPFPDRYVAIRKAERELEQAEACLQRRLSKYAKLDELPQSNLNPQFFFLSRIYAHRAKLYVFFSSYMRKLDRWETLLEPIKLLEKARIYAARDGSPALYAQWSAYQSWCYIMLAYLGSENEGNQGFSYEECLDWADRLVDHAKLCYSAMGKICYQQIKDAGGRTTEYVHSAESPSAGDAVTAQSSKVTRRHVKTEKYYEKYGSTMIEVIPLIQELIYSDKHTDHQAYKQAYKQGSHVVSLDVSLLKEPGQDEGRSIYLFGMQSSILVFAQGMLSLCKPYENDRALINAIQQEALRLFTYCCAIASDGTDRNINKNNWPSWAEPDSLILDRAFPEDLSIDDLQASDHLLQCLYPHRLTQFADLGKIFIMVCELVLLVTSSPVQSFYASKQSWQKIEPHTHAKITKICRLIRELRQNDNFPFPISEACGQKRYNSHLAEHYVQLEKYVERFIVKLQKKQLKNTEAIAVRHHLVADIFEIIRGGIDILP